MLLFRGLFSEKLTFLLYMHVMDPKQSSPETKTTGGRPELQSSISGRDKSLLYGFGANPVF